MLSLKCFILFYFYFLENALYSFVCAAGVKITSNLLCKSLIIYANFDRSRLAQFYSPHSCERNTNTHFCKLLVTSVLKLLLFTEKLNDKRNYVHSVYTFSPHHIFLCLLGGSRRSDGAQNALWASATVSQCDHANTGDSCHSAECCLGGEPRLLQTAGSQQRGQHQRDSTGF